MGALMGGAALAEQDSRGVPGCVTGGGILAQALGIKQVHESAGDVVVHGPQGHDHTARAGHAEGAFQTQHAFAVA